jgi:hypothetical protein
MYLHSLSPVRLTLIYTPLPLVFPRARRAPKSRQLKHGANAEAEDNQGRTPLLVAVAQEKNEVASMLLEHGANADAKDNQGRTPLTSEKLLYFKWFMKVQLQE